MIRKWGDNTEGRLFVKDLPGFMAEFKSMAAEMCDLSSPIVMDLKLYTDLHDFLDEYEYELPLPSILDRKTNELLPSDSEHHMDSWTDAYGYFLDNFAQYLDAERSHLVYYEARSSTLRSWEKGVRRTSRLPELHELKEITEYIRDNMKPEDAAKYLTSGVTLIRDAAKELLSGGS